MDVYERAITAEKLPLFLNGTITGTFHREGSQTKQLKNELAFFSCFETVDQNESLYENMSFSYKFDYIVVLETEKELRHGTGYYFGGKPFAEYYSYNISEMNVIAVYKIKHSRFGLSIDREHNLLNELRR